MNATQASKVLNAVKAQPVRHESATWSNQVPDDERRARAGRRRSDAMTGWRLPPFGSRPLPGRARLKLGVQLPARSRSSRASSRHIPPIPHAVHARPGQSRPNWTWLAIPTWEPFSIKLPLSARACERSTPGPVLTSTTGRPTSPPPPPPHPPYGRSAHRGHPCGTRFACDRPPSHILSPRAAMRLLWCSLRADPSRAECESRAVCPSRV